ncbi:MAG TPA: tetratricopeptide repeat protein [Longimicrobium sp.]
MQVERELPAPTAAAGRVIVLEAPRGSSRRRVLTEWIGRAGGEAGGARLLPCDVSENGLWAGVNTLLGGVLPLAEAHDPALLEKHAREIAAVLPTLKRTLGVESTLTESAVGVEAVRNYAMDRAYRIPHGIIDLLDTLSRVAPSHPARVLACDDYDRAGALVRRFFRELVRRRGREFGLTLLLAVEPGGAAEALEQIGDRLPASVVRLDLAPDRVVPRTPAEMTRLARELEEQIKRNFEEMEDRIPELIRYWLESEFPENAPTWQAFALGRYNHRGFYEDALRFADPVLANLATLGTGVGYYTRWNLVGSIFGCLVAAGQPERAHEVVRSEALEKITDPTDRARVCYIMAMLHARFLPERDPDKAEHYLLEALALLDAPSIVPETRHFLRVFLNNGLALVRHRQGRPAEAVELCRAGFDQLEEYVPGDRHRLHRSVLLYNIAQVYTATRDYEKAIEYFRGAMEMDPNYSEYFNERGNVLLKLGRYDEAIRDYHEAIRLSPPYAEVWTNLGQCFRRLGRMQEAEAAYARAIDLDPGVKLAHAGRAHALDVLGRTDEALEEYDAALALDPAQAVLLSNRAALLYRAGRLAESLADLDRAVALEPSNPVLYRNRAAALADLERADDAACDLERYLELMPSAPDRAEVEQRLAAFRGSAVPV